ncbi:hypothetical protein LWC34_39180 [Kibdelosporangium philippinense]|uniref:Uncharacterized protein n=1 Tax=Kibdelosporangium philippinense TaxID=211113 RepID=A0ABS8ZMI6_9PSEU|nr:gephyrin-like molybdotransferase receptor GlpR [Kibdelosporangium philippinense]MCE7008792.1 hypothetical protein [Kibdelosporangium philippinense]
MPSSLIVVALVLAWLVVLVPMIVRKRQEIARTADSALNARVVRKGGAEEIDLRDTDDVEDETGHAHGHDFDDDYDDEDADDMDSATEHPEALDTADEPDDRDHVATDSVAQRSQSRPYRPGRGGFDPEAAALTARAKYAFRQRVVVAMLLLAVGSAVVAGVMYAQVWWGHGAIDLTLVGYLTYLRRQVRIEEEIRQRRTARIAQTRRARPEAEADYEEDYRDSYSDAHRDTHRDAEDRRQEPAERREPVTPPVAKTTQPRITHPHAVVVDIDDEDPAFDELDDLDSLRYRRAVGE